MASRVCALGREAGSEPAFAVNRLAVNLGMSVGPAVGGYLAEINFPSIFRVNGAASFAAFLIGGVVGFLVIVVTDGGRKTKVPFGPFMILGAFLALFFGQPVVDWYASAIGL